MRNNDSKRLADIVGENPFLDVCEKWAKQMECKRNASLSELCADKYILPYDERELGSHQNEFCDFTRGLRTALLPQPFIGNPSADYWYIQINPRGSWIDFYDFISCNQDLKVEICQKLAEDERVRRCNVTGYEFLKEGDGELEALMKRQELYINQLDLSRETHPFYPMSPAFRTIKNRTSRRLIGSRNWWHSAFCVNNQYALFHDVFVNAREDSKIADELGQKLFVMEFFPYASESACVARRIHSQESYRKHPYCKFVVNMLRYAQDMGKYIIFRSQKELDQLRNFGISITSPYVLIGRRVFLLKHFLRR